MTGVSFKRDGIFSFPMISLWTLCVDAELVVSRTIFDATQEVLILLRGGVCVSDANWLVLIKSPQYSLCKSKGQIPSELTGCKIRICSYNPIFLGSALLVITCGDYGDGAGTHGKGMGRRGHVAMDLACVKFCRNVHPDPRLSAVTNDAPCNTANSSEPLFPPTVKGK